MRYFVLDTLADAGDGEYCFTDEEPDGVDLHAHRLSVGETFAAHYPQKKDAMRLALGDDYMGLKLPSFLGNTSSAVIVNNQTADIMLSHNVGQVERFAFVLLDHKGRVYSRDYVYLNPLQKIACLNEDLSEVHRTRKGTLMEITKLVLDKRKADDLPDLWRLGEDPTVYLCSEKLVAALRDQGCSNFEFTEATMG